MKLDRVVRRRIIEQCQGLPWLLKKLLVHLGKQIKEGKNQNDLIVGKFNIAPLFQEDLERLNDTQVKCLKYIAYNSPIDINTITEHFSTEVVNTLYNIRLIIRIGHKYSVYWDIFRDYIINNEAPNIPLTYLPKTSPVSIIKLLEIINHYEELSFDDLTEKTNYSSKSAMNILSDCLMFTFIIKNRTGNYSYNNELSDDIKLRKFLNEQLKEHVIVHSLQDMKNNNKEIMVNTISTIINNFHKEEKFSDKSTRQYTNNILRWLQWASIIIVSGNSITLVDKPDFSIEYNMRSRKGLTKGVPGPLFMCTSGPKQAFELIKLVKNVTYNNEFLKKSHRNSISDLKALEIITYDNNVYLKPELLYLDEKELYQEILRRAVKSDFIKLILKSPISGASALVISAFI